ncbi:MAG: DUF4412 domain-containing protein [Acidobacteria bacterium]|nr:DUF4412 domain-containing protein [Acidobacteriota bacterium]
MSINNSWTRRISLFLFLLSVSIFLRAQAPPQFKADMQMSGRGNNMQGKIYFSGGKMRMEMAMGGQSQVMITDPVKKAVYMVMPEQELYMEMNANAPGPMKPPKVEAMDPANPCSSEGVTACKKLGTETVNGYASEKWEFTQERQKYTAWIATKLRLPIKTVAADGTSVEFRNIVEGAQPANLFVVPADYEKMDMGGMGGMMGMGGMPGMGGMSGMAGMGGMSGMEEMAAMSDSDAEAEDSDSDSEPGSVWEEGNGWVMNVTITAKGTSEERSQISENRTTVTAKYVVSVPLNYGTPAVMGMMGPMWTHLPGQEMGSPEAQRKPVTYSAEWEYQTIARENLGCQGEATGNSTGTRTTKGTVAAKGSMTGKPSALLNVTGVLRISPDLETYAILVGALDGEGSEQTTWKFEDHCDAKQNKNETSPPVTRSLDVKQFEIKDLPLPSSRTALTGTKTIPWPLSVGPFGMETQATVQWNITPL